MFKSLGSFATAVEAAVAYAKAAMSSGDEHGKQEEAATAGEVASERAEGSAGAQSTTKRHTDDTQPTPNGPSQPSCPTPTHPTSTHRWQGGLGPV